ncbi:hypothetical protein EVAR_75160_1 [Eumeta japonica]|uniref:Uncharacterized protein n=1 Tax=Eumeta variegata TaxID=151549 RepID=A0A4C1U0Z0_EUMVA|nr:hypothetical protein EVAR_75160_1 [Eumeta japonica]
MYRNKWFERSTDKRSKPLKGTADAVLTARDCRLFSLTRRRVHSLSWLVIVTVLVVLYGMNRSQYNARNCRSELSTNDAMRSDDEEARLFQNSRCCRTGSRPTAERCTPPIRSRKLRQPARLTATRPRQTAPAVKTKFISNSVGGRRYSGRPF